MVARLSARLGNKPVSTLGMVTLQNGAVDLALRRVDRCLGKPRICMPIFSAFAKNAFRTGLREAQDVLAACDDTEFIQLNAARGFGFKERWLMRLSYHDPFRKLICLNPGLEPVQLTQDYDLFVLVCPYWRDVWYANAIRGWRDHCKTAVCWIDELWAKEVPELDHWLHLLSNFDFMIFGISGSSEPVSKVIGRPCHDIMGGVDAIRFSPYPNPPARAIDVYSIGRRYEKIHQSLLDLASRKELFYVHDTCQTGDSPTPDHRQHRDMYANMAKRSHLFTVAPGKVNVSRQTAGQHGIGFRYFEGAAAGTVMVGQAPDSELFRRTFDWPDAVVELQPDGSDTAAVVSNLLSEPERLRQISLRNAEETLRRFDWVYRWKQILRIAGLTPTPAMEARERRLDELAEAIRQERMQAHAGSTGVSF